MTRRNERASELIKRTLGKLLVRKVNDPRVSELVSITKVAISSDFKQAEVSISILGDEKTKKEALEGCNAASGFLRSELASHLKLRHTPQLIFCYDDSIEYGAKILALMDEVSNDELTNRKSYTGS
jgi:ribosome-binding factor A